MQRSRNSQHVTKFLEFFCVCPRILTRYDLHGNQRKCQKTLVMMAGLCFQHIPFIGSRQVVEHLPQKSDFGVLPRLSLVEPISINLARNMEKA